MDSIDSYKDNLTKMISNETDENGYDNFVKKIEEGNIELNKNII